jgi:hypothetical protein
MEEQVEEFKLTPAQARFWRSKARYQDFEGAVRSGKTTIALIKMQNRCEQYPGMHWLICRYSEENTRLQLKARCIELFGSGLGKWNTEESCFDLKNGSRVYVRGLKPGENVAPFSKFAGLTLAGIIIDQAEELPPEYFPALQARLSQSGYPLEMYLLPNPPDEYHWLAKFFPEDNPDPEYFYCRTSVYDNKRNLPDGYVESLERAYPPGNVLRRRFIEGRRGLSVTGEPVYGEVFSRAHHVVPELSINPDLPLVESWDFGHSHPAVLWSQFGLGTWHVLGELLGHNEFIETFAPKVLQMRKSISRLGVGTDDGLLVSDVQVCCDPAGFSSSNQGHGKNVVEILHDYGIHPQSWPKGYAPNHPIQRNAAIQQYARALSTMVRGAPSVLLHPRAANFIDGTEAGYVWEDQRRYHSSTYPTLRRPKKDGLYDHLQNCAEYSWLLFGPNDITAQTIEKQRTKDYYRELRRKQRDFEPEDFARQRRRSRRGVGL